jgi:hypothetical protein
MKSSIPITVLLSALCALPIAALANPHDDSNRQAAQPRQAAPVRQQASSNRMQAPVRSQQSAYRPQTQQYRQQPQQTQQYRQQTQQYRQQPVQQRNVQPTPRYQSRSSVNVAYVSRRDAVAWDWNRGNVWYSQPSYWGGGFWGAFSLGLAFNGNNYNNQYYAVQQSSPGAQLLQQYGLTQTTCDQANLVDITGPDGGEICAYPNDMVSPGQYNVDPSTLSLVSN